jgi:tol-pal system protein YbgF
MAKLRLPALVTGVSVIFLAATPVSAQLFNRPPATVPGDGFAQTQAVDAAGLLVRIDRLENQVRSLNGQLEQMQFQMRRMEDQLRKFQQDVDYRFQENSGKPAPRQQQQQPATTPQRRTEIDPPAGRAALRGDAFDPDVNPAAPGVPRQLGQLQNPGANNLPPPGDVFIDEEIPIDTPDAPLDLSPRGIRDAAPRQNAASVDPGFPTLPRMLPQTPPAQSQAAQSQGRAAAAVQGPLGDPQPGSGALAALPPPTGPAAEYDASLAQFRAGQFEEAGNGFQDFLRKYPRDRRVSEAVFYLGESFARRGRHREAAEQYLKVSTDFSKAARAPEAMLKLGMSLDKLGMKEQACATFSEVGRKFPNATPALRTSAEREQKRNQC